jgi:type II secretory pathway pseudopilin PulG
MSILSNNKLRLGLIALLIVGIYVGIQAPAWRLNARIRSLKQAAATYKTAQDSYKSRFGVYSEKAHDGLVDSKNGVLVWYFDSGQLPAHLQSLLAPGDKPFVRADAYVVLLGFGDEPLKFLIRIDGIEPPREIVLPELPTQ